VRSKASINQLNLPHGTKTKPDMLKTVSSQSPLCQSGRCHFLIKRARKCQKWPLFWFSDVSWLHATK